MVFYIYLFHSVSLIRILSNISFMFVNQAQHYLFYHVMTTVLFLFLYSFVSSFSCVATQKTKHMRQF